MLIKRTKSDSSNFNQIKQTTLLIDGESLLKTGFYGIKGIQTTKGSTGVIYYFLSKIKNFYENYGITKAVVFWEGENSKDYRRSYYKHYKTNRDEYIDLGKQDDLIRQRQRIKQYLEELFIRQVEVTGCEADDCIARYVTFSENERKIILTSDRDLLQLLNNDTSVYLLDKKMVITPYTFNYIFKYHYGNVGLLKIIAGDKSDNISGIKNVGEDTVFKLFPEIKTEKKDIQWILERADVLSKEKTSNSIKNILGGETKWGTWGKEYYSIMDKVINLHNPYITEESDEYIKSYITEPLDPEGREGLPAIQKMLIEDEIYNMLPKNDNDYFTFWKSFITIINKEKNIFYDRIKQ